MGKKNRKEKKHFNESYQEHQGYDDKQGDVALFDLTRIQERWDELDPHQRRYAEAIGYKKVVGVNAGSGTGKTTIAVMRGLELLRQGKIDRIQYVRFPDKRSLSLGFFPGGPTEKEQGFMKPFFKACETFGLQKEMVHDLIASETIILSTDIQMRGDTFERTFMIVDEAQNGDISSLKLVLTRIVDNGYAVVIGHSLQCDSKLPRYGPDNLLPFEVYLLHMDEKPFTEICQLQHDYRGVISQWADKIELTLAKLENQVKVIKEKTAS